MATLTDVQKSLIRLYTDDPAGPDELVKDSVLQGLWDEMDSIEGVASRVWRIKAATVSEWYLSNIDGSFLSRNQVFEHCLKMAEHYETLGGVSGVFVNVGLTGPNATDEDSSSEF